MRRKLDGRVAYVTFDDNQRNNKQYAYWCPFKAKVGDTAIVDSPYGGLVRVTIRSFSEFDVLARKSLIAVQDLAAINKAKKLEEEARERDARRKVIKAELDQMLKDDEYNKRVAALARTNATARKLVRELKALS